MDPMDLNEVETLSKCGVMTRLQGAESGIVRLIWRVCSTRASMLNVRALLATPLFNRTHHLLFTMPPRKKLKTDHVEEGLTTTSRRSTRTTNKATNVKTPNAPGVQPPVTSSVPAVVKLRRGCLKEIPNFAIEIQLMVGLLPKYCISE